MNDPFEIEKARAERINSLVGGKFGRPKRGPKVGEGLHVPLVAGFVGGSYGFAGGAASYKPRERKKLEAQRLANSKTMRSNTKKINQAMREKTGVSKAKIPGRGNKVYRITDKGTLTGKIGYHGDSLPPRERQRVLSRGTKISGATFGVGGFALGRSSQKDSQKKLETTVNRQQAKITRQKDELKTLGVSKAYTKEQKQRRGDAAAIGAYAGAGAGYFAPGAAVRSTNRVKEGFRAGKAQREFNASLDAATGNVRSRTRSAGSAVKTGLGTARKLPKGAVGGASYPSKLVGLGVGVAGGSVGGGVAYDKYRQKKDIKKNDPFNIEKLTRQEKKGLIVGGVGGLAGPPGSALASGYLAPKGKKAKYAAAGAAGGLAGPVGGAGVGYLAASSKKKVKKNLGTSAFGVDHG